MLTTYQSEHLLPTYRRHAPELLPPTIEASRAHVVMLAERGLVPRDRARAMLRGLESMRRGPLELPEYDGTFEDAYFAFERLLAAAAGIEPRELDVQLARSRNDLDAGIFRMILRAQVDDVVRALTTTAEMALAAAERTAEVVVIGLTHRRPAQPTTLGHVLAGYAEAVVSELAVYASVLRELDRSPLGSCAFAGTDLPIAPERLAELLGFEGRVVNSYEAVAGADHLVAVGLANARSLATGARMVRVLQDWMTWGWIETPADYCQGSSIMPQKRNPVVLEHLVSMAGMALADAQSVSVNVASAWWEDSNNATTDVQVRLWESNDRARRFFTLMAGLFESLTVQSPPTEDEIVAAGTTTTAAADVLSLAGVPFRAAHSALGRLVREGPPAGWTIEQVRSAVADAAGTEIDTAIAERLLLVARSPRTVLERAQDDGPGASAVRDQVRRLSAAVEDATAGFETRRSRIAEAERALDAAVGAVLA